MAYVGNLPSTLKVGDQHVKLHVTLSQLCDIGRLNGKDLMQARDSHKRYIHIVTYDLTRIALMTSFIFSGIRLAGVGQLGKIYHSHSKKATITSLGVQGDQVVKASICPRYKKCSMERLKHRGLSSVQKNWAFEWYRGIRSHVIEISACKVLCMHNTRWKPIHNQIKARHSSISM